ncbi:amidohydrolase family protein [Methylomonas sp. LL1]|uniref:amidohydrolase family protein n=1 Tax=Methylomonas sp. LL1 TaxID=2785785 RepID=UPI0018C39890|nr:amidohydrolase family protein [Methylomonas sp. LL1]QPK63180.1 amidohydrolase family protein [Methylomonas sp. LL1]
MKSFSRSNSSIPANGSRRRFLKLTAAGLVTASPPASALFRLTNPCLDPAATPVSALESAAWQGIDPADWWDCHTHIVGSGDGGSGITQSPDMHAPLRHPIQTLQHWAYANAACIGDVGAQDIAFVERLQALLDTLPKGAKAMLFAFDRAHGASGDPDHANTSFFVPNEYARALAQQYPDRFEWVASIHPYRPDCVAVLEQAAANGARAVKWLPPAMGIDPASPQCDRFYKAAAKLNIPIISHGGEEKAVHGANQPLFGNPLRLRRALDAGVRVVIAHCASIGTDIADDGREVRSFDIFTQLMAEKQWRQQLFGDISAIVLRNRDPEVIKTLLTETGWHSRLLYGSDYPLTGILPLISPKTLAEAGLLAEDAVEPLLVLQDYHPFRFDFVLKRSLSWRGQRFADTLFATRPFFTEHP